MPMVSYTEENGIWTSPGTEQMKTQHVREERIASGVIGGSLAMPIAPSPLYLVNSLNHINQEPTTKCHKPPSSKHLINVLLPTALPHQQQPLLTYMVDHALIKVILHLFDSKVAGVQVLGDVTHVSPIRLEWRPFTHRDGEGAPGGRAERHLSLSKSSYRTRARSHSHVRQANWANETSNLRYFIHCLLTPWWLWLTKGCWMMPPTLRIAPSTPPSAGSLYHEGAPSSTTGGSTQGRF